MNCPGCNSPSDGMKFCANCGMPLTPQSRDLKSYLDEQLHDEIAKRFKDKRLIELETSIAVAERIKRWTTLFAYFVGIPLAVVLIGAGVFGFDKYSDLARLASSVQDEVKPRLQQITTDADAAERLANDAKQKADAAEKTTTAVTAQVNGQIGSASRIVQNVQELSKRVSDLEKQTSHQMQASSKRIEDSVVELDKKMSAATQDIAEQQKKLANTDELVKTLFSKGTTEYLPLAINLPTVVVVPVNNGGGAMVFVLLKSAPIYQTLELKWRVASQPRSSYTFNNNAVIFFWGEPADNLKQNPLEVTYVPDPTVKVPPFKALSRKDNGVYADETLIMAVPPSK
jgi:gas vesicle protein